MQESRTYPLPGHSGDRLDSWKAIARYLNRTVRTAHRWEESEGLPVHRHLHERQSTVYAYTTEIDAWLAARDASPSKPSPAHVWPRYAAAVGVATIAALVAVLLLDFSGNSQTGSARSVAVLPFQTSSDDPADAPLAFGIAEEVLNRLSAVPELAVIARSSAFAFDESTDPVDVSERLGVSYLVVGSLQRDGDALRIQARLVDRGGRQVWTRRFDGAGTSLFDLQDTIAQAVVSSIAPHITRRESNGPPPDPESYRLYLLGREYMWLAEHGAAADAFSRAVGIAPDYAEALGSLALVRALQTQWIMDRVTLDEARETVADALSVRDDLAEAHAALGILNIVTGRVADGEAPIRRALALDPGLIEAHLWLVTALQQLGRYEEAERQLEDALALDPLHPVLNQQLARSYWLRGDYDSARERLVRILDLPKPPHQAYLRLAELNREYGRLVEALQWAQEGALVNSMYSGIFGLIQAYLSLDMVGEADRWYGHLLSFEGDSLPRLGIHSEYLFRRGRFEQTYALKADYVRRSGLALSELPFAVQETFGGMQILTGRYEEGVAALEPWFDADFDLPVRLGGEVLPLTFAQFLAYGYQKLGRNNDAGRLLDRIQHHIDALRDSGIGYRPNLYVVEARNKVLMNRPDEALVSLNAAVEIGWRDFGFEQVIPLWDPLVGDPQFEAVMQFVRDDVERQRARVSNRDDNADVEAAVLARIADPRRPAAGNTN